MQDKKQSWQCLSEESEAVLEEYKTPRAEILTHQQFVHQYNTLGATLGGIFGALITLSLKDPAPGNERTCVVLAIASALLCLLYFFLIMGQVYRRMKETRIGRYIECMIEARIQGLYWESVWSRGGTSDGLPHPAFFEGGLLVTLQLLFALLSGYLFYLGKSTGVAVVVLSGVLFLMIFEIHSLLRRVRHVRSFTREWISVRERCFSDVPKSR